MNQSDQPRSFFDITGKATAEKAGMFNAYSCPKCGHLKIVILRDSGTTWAVERCSRCGNDAWSMWYRLPERWKLECHASHEFYRPTDKEFEKLEACEKDHCRSGGLLLRPNPNFVMLPKPRKFS